MTTGTPSRDESRTAPNVSIIMPAFNAARTILLAINSLLAQSLASFEVLVGDDGSTDGTDEQVKAIGDPRVQLFRHDENVGPGATRNQLLANARGAWITFCDADDMWQPDRLAKLIAAAHDFEETVVFDDIMECHSTAHGLIPWRRLRGPRAFGASDKPVHITAGELIGSNRMLMQPMFSRSLLLKSGAFHSLHAYGEDSFFLLKLLAHCNDLVYVPEALYFYRITPRSASYNSRRHEMLCGILEDAINDFKDYPNAQSALKRKIISVRRNAIYQPFLDAVKQCRVARSLDLAAHHPWVFPTFLWRTLCSLPYHLHRFSHGGSTRGSK